MILRDHTRHTFSLRGTTVDACGGSTPLVEGWSQRDLSKKKLWHTDGRTDRWTDRRDSRNSYVDDLIQTSVIFFEWSLPFLMYLKPSKHSHICVTPVVKSHTCPSGFVFLRLCHNLVHWACFHSNPHEPHFLETDVTIDTMSNVIIHFFLSFQFPHSSCQQFCWHFQYTDEALIQKYYHGIMIWIVKKIHFINYVHHHF